MLTLIWNAILMLGLVGLNGFFVAAEFAMVKVSSSRMEVLASEGSRRARFAKVMVRNVDASLSACQLGITLTSLGLGWLGEPLASSVLEPLLRPLGMPPALVHTLSFLIAFTLVTALHITIGEQFPKTYAIRRSEQVTLLAALPLAGFHRLMSPLISFLNRVSNALLRLAGIEPTREYRSVHTEEEIRVLMKESSKSGLIDAAELTLMDNIFDFADTHAREIMIPRTEMVCLYAFRSYEENKTIAISEMHTRYPVCDPDKDSIVGFVHIKDLLRETGSEPSEMHSIIRPMTKVPESMQISALLKLMQKQKSQMALLIDEYGGTSGLVTFEDIIEEIVGEIQDEFDEERPQIEKRDDGAYSIDGRLLIEEVNSFFGLRIESDSYDTIGGWIYSQVEIPPTRQQVIVWEEEADFVIEELDQLRISRIILRRRAGGREQPLPGSGEGSS